MNWWSPTVSGTVSMEETLQVSHLVNINSSLKITEEFTSSFLKRLMQLVKTFNTKNNYFINSEKFF